MKNREILETLLRRHKGVESGQADPALQKTSLMDLKLIF